MKLLLDTDIMLYQSILATEYELDWGSDIWTLYTDLNEAKNIFNTQIINIKNQLNSDDILCCLSDPKANFRKVVDPSYKSNRKSTRKPVGYVALRNWVIEKFPTLGRPTLEADDVMGIEATRPENIGKTIIVSSDKDMKTIPCRLYRPMQDELLDITEQQADAYFFQQTLTGDSTDGYSGCKGVGEKTAAKILGSRPTWELVEQAYVKAGMTRDDAIRQARLARILRWSDWHSEKKEVRLWIPQVLASQ